MNKAFLGFCFFAFFFLTSATDVLYLSPNLPVSQQNTEEDKTVLDNQP